MCGCKWQKLLFKEKFCSETPKRRIQIYYQSWLPCGEWEKDQRGLQDRAEFEVRLLRNIRKDWELKTGVRKDSDRNKK